MILKIIGVVIGLLLGILSSAFILVITTGATLAVVATLLMVLWNHVVPTFLPTVASIDWLTALYGVLLITAMVISLRVGKIWTMMWSGV